MDRNGHLCGARSFGIYFISGYCEQTLESQVKKFRFKFNKNKTVQSIAMVLKMAGGKANLYKVMNLLYLAERQALIETGMFFTGCTFLKEDYGVRLSQFLKYLESTTRFSRAGDEIQLLKDPGDDDLCDYFVEVLENLHKRFDGLGLEIVIKAVKTLPEYNNGNSIITAEDIFLVAGLDEETMEHYWDRNENVLWFDELLKKG